MRRRFALIGLGALLPAMLGAAPLAARAGGVLVPVCTGDGQVRMIEVPGAPGGDGGEQVPCCAKGCHGGSSRKKLARTPGAGQ